MSLLTSSGIHADLSGVKVERGDLKWLDQRKPAAVAVFCFSDVRPLCGVAGFLDWRLCGAISRRIETGDFAGHVDEVLLLPSEGRLGRQLVFAFGLGTLADCNRQVLSRVCREAYRVMRRAGVANPMFAAPSVHGGGQMEAEFVQSVADELKGEIGGVLVES
ncbi:MAG: hypothetical protein A2289_00770 [Deltaproteobacteria bacterium RIFOXYA12_FULL_58_15]|nr:MAG: hypothetical protein A2289_00770 [Deltaproteobacteria bacterium RIFOXYA12_FULL_58_15]OGR08517.1 MAG: hypothetical protein A2341_25215 [Deltaproteobacteria bacterium RIFOXYB12_FULL_58_9]